AAPNSTVRGPSAYPDPTRRIIPDTSSTLQRFEVEDFAAPMTRAISLSGCGSPQASARHCRIRMDRDRAGARSRSLLSIVESDTGISVELDGVHTVHEFFAVEQQPGILRK